MVSRSEIVRSIRNRSSRGASLRRVDAMREEPRLVRAAQQQFGSWAAAVTKSGLQPQENQRWSKARVVAEIRSRKRQRLELAVSKVPGPLRDAAKRYFGGWQAAIEKAGLNYERVRIHPASMSEVELLRALRTAATEARRGIGANGFITRSIARQARAHFGTLRAALEKAGLDPARVLQRQVYSGGEIEKELRLLAKAHPTLTMTELHQLSVGRAARARFGTLRIALDVLGIHDWPRKPQRRRSPR